MTDGGAETDSVTEAGVQPEEATAASNSFLDRFNLKGIRRAREIAGQHSGLALVAGALWGPGIVALTVGDKLQPLTEQASKFLAPLGTQLSYEQVTVITAALLASGFLAFAGAHALEGSINNATKS